MNNPHTAAAAQIIAHAINQLEQVNANAQSISDGAYKSDDTTPDEDIRAARKALRVIEASGALESLKQIDYNLSITEV